MGFFKTTSTLSEKHESGDFQDILDLSGEGESKTVTTQTQNFKHVQIWQNSENSNLKKQFELDENTRKWSF